MILSKGGTIDSHTSFYLSAYCVGSCVGKLIAADRAPLITPEDFNAIPGYADAPCSSVSFSSTIEFDTIIG